MAGTTSRVLTQLLRQQFARHGAFHISKAQGLISCHKPRLETLLNAGADDRRPGRLGPKTDRSAEWPRPEAVDCANPVRVDSAAPHRLVKERPAGRRRQLLTRAPDLVSGRCARGRPGK